MCTKYFMEQSSYKNAFSRTCVRDHFQCKPVIVRNLLGRPLLYRDHFATILLYKSNFEYEFKSD